MLRIAAPCGSARSGTGRAVDLRVARRRVGVVDHEAVHQAAARRPENAWVKVGAIERGVCQRALVGVVGRALGTEEERGAELTGHRAADRTRARSAPSIRPPAAITGNDVASTTAGSRFESECRSRAGSSSKPPRCAPASIPCADSASTPRSVAQLRLVDIGDGHDDARARALQRVDDVAGRAAERKAHHGDRVVDEERDLRVPVVVVPSAVAERDPELLRDALELAEVGVEVRLVTRVLAGDEHVDPERRVGELTGARDLGSHLVGLLVPRGQEPEPAGLAHRGRQRRGTTGRHPSAPGSPGRRQLGQPVRLGSHEPRLPHGLARSRSRGVGCDAPRPMRTRSERGRSQSGGCCPS